MKRLMIISVILFCIASLFSCKTNIEFNEEYVVNIVDGDIIDGKDEMDSFYRRTKEGEKLKITINKSFTESGSTYTNYIIYDGTYYITDATVLEGGPKESKFKYLNYSETNGFGNHIIKTEAYCLSNDKDMTYEKITNSWFSSLFEDLIFDSIPICSCYYFIDLCFRNTKVLNIEYNDRKYPVNGFNQFAASELVDGLTWSKANDIEFKNNKWNLSIAMNRTILNDANGLLLGKKGSTISVKYSFDFENKIAIMDYLDISSLTGRLYATLTTKDIEKINELLSTYQG